MIKVVRAKASCDCHAKRLFSENSLSSINSRLLTGILTKSLVSTEGVDLLKVITIKHFYGFVVRQCIG